jgi:hypothetical protein
MMTTNKPTVLVSSTIYDFADLRSALKHWLAERGFDAMLSEFNDFPKQLDDNSYESCINAISKADYFILLIGARVGGWYNETQRVSITRMEYKYALESFKRSGRPRLAIFVRQNLWDIREDRKALEALLETDHREFRELPAAVNSKLAGHSSRFVNDAETIFDFLREVGQIEQMKAATRGKAEFPKANWIHLFSSFADIVDALRIAFGIHKNTDQLLLLENLRTELMRNLSHLLYKDKENGDLSPKSDLGKPAADSIVGGVDGQSIMPACYIGGLVIFRVFTMNVPLRLSTIFIQQAMETGIFMRYSPQSGKYENTLAHTALSELLSLIESSQRTQSITEQQIQPFAEKFREISKRNSEVPVRNWDLGIACSEVRVFERMTNLHVALLKWISGDASGLSGLGPWSLSPYPIEADKIKRSQISVEEASSWVFPPKNKDAGS